MKGHGKFPMLVTEEGETLFETNAIATFLARQAGILLGSSAFEEAQIEQWNDIGATAVMSPLVDVAYSTFGHKPSTTYANSIKDLKK